MSNTDSNKAREKATQLFLDASTFVRYVAFRTAPTACLVDDIVNEAFIYFTENADRFDLDRDVHSLLQTITQNMARRQWRIYQKNKPEKLQQLGKILTAEMQHREEAGEKLLLDEELVALDLCLNRLTPSSREFVEFHYYEGMTTVEYAKQKGLNVESLRKALTRIRLFLRKCVQNALGILGNE